MAFSLPHIADAIAESLAREAQRLDAEQSVTGLDALDELELHPVLAEGLRAAGWTIWPEQHYPEGGRRRRDTEGERCDMVLTPRDRELHDPGAEPTLFDSPDDVAPEDAFWLEVKVVNQFTPEGPNAHYASQLLSTVGEDVVKLSRHEGIRHGALLIVLFTEDRPTAEHDLAQWLDRCLQRSLPVESPYLRAFEVADRLGNALCAAALVPVRHRGE